MTPDSVAGGQRRRDVVGNALKVVTDRQSLMRDAWWHGFAGSFLYAQ
jgi:hypothetical protein